MHYSKLGDFVDVESKLEKIGFKNASQVKMSSNIDH
jgi:hypothetical protein